MRAGHETGDIEQLNRDGADPFLTGAVVGLASLLQRRDAVLGLVVGEGCSRAGAWDVEVADRAVRIYGREGKVACRVVSERVDCDVDDESRTYFCGGVRQTVQRGGLARGWLAHEGDERVAWHAGRLIGGVDGDALVL